MDGFEVMKLIAFLALWGMALFGPRMSHEAECAALVVMGAVAGIGFVAAGMSPVVALVIVSAAAAGDYFLKTHK